MTRKEGIKKVIFILLFVVLVAGVGIYFLLP